MELHNPACKHRTGREQYIMPTQGMPDRVQPILVSKGSVVAIHFNMWL